MTNEYLSENTELPEQSATNTKLEEPTSLNFSEIEIVSVQQVDNVFNVLFDKVIRSNQPANNDSDKLEIIQRKIEYFYTTTNKAFWLNLSITGCLFFMILALLTSLINNTTTIPKSTILLSYFYFSIGFCFFLLYLVLLIIKMVNDIGPLKNSQEIVEEDFKKAGDTAKIGDWQIVKELIKSANFNKEILEYAKSKLNFLIQAREDNKNTTDNFIKVLASIIVITFIFVWNPYNILQEIITPNELKDLSVVLALISAIIATIVFIWQFSHTVQSQFEISKFKSCIYFLEQAELMINYIKNNENPARENEIL